MTHPIIKTENYLLVGSNDDLRRGWFYCVRKNDIFQDEGEDVHCCMGDIRIAAHLPLNNAPTLEGVPLLPPIEDEAEELAKKYGSSIWDKRGRCVFDSMRYKYTEEDLRKAIKMAKVMGYGDSATYPMPDVYDEEEIIQSLQQPKYPVAFDCEMVDKGEEDWIGDDITGEPFWNQKLEPKTIINSQGLTQLVGKYIY